MCSRDLVGGIPQSSDGGMQLLDEVLPNTATECVGFNRMLERNLLKNSCNWLAALSRSLQLKEVLLPGTACAPGP